MGTFTITQTTPNDDKLFIYPEGDLSSCTAWTAVGETNNYQCVDENKNSVDYTDYVSMAATASTLDLYDTQDHTAETGTINYVKLYNMVRTLAAPSSGLEYYITVSPDSTCTHVYYSDAKNLTTGWAKKSYVWEDNPQTAVAWSWANIDALAIGMRALSPVVKQYFSTTLRPNSDAAPNDWTAVGETNNYECVDESVANDNTDYVTSDVNMDEEYYGFVNPTPTGTIDDVKYFVRYGSGIPGHFASIFPVFNSGIDVGGVKAYAISGIGLPDGVEYTNASKTWDTNPSGGAWTWANINDMKAYTLLVTTPGNDFARMTQIYVVVNSHTTADSTEVQVTQCYAEVGYTPSTTTCYLNCPTEFSGDHSRNVKMINFWNGEREVYDLSRSSKTIVLNGEEFYHDECNATCPCERITCIRNLGLNGAYITLSDLDGSHDLVNGDYHIRSFGWHKISDNPVHYKWILELEGYQV